MSDGLGKIRELTVKLQASEDRYRAIAELATDGYWDWLIRDGIEYYSDRFWEILGYDPDEMADTPEAWQSIIFPEDKRIASDALARHISTHGKHPYRIDVRYVHRDGSTVRVLCRGSVIEWDGDEAVRMVGTHTLMLERE